MPSPNSIKLAPISEDRRYELQTSGGASHGVVFQPAERISMRVSLDSAHLHDFSTALRLLEGDREEFGMSALCFAVTVGELLRAHRIALEALHEDP